MRRTADRVVSLSDAVAGIKDGWNLTFGGFAHLMGPMALVRELIRAGKRDLDLTGVAECWAADTLAGAGALRRVRFSNFMFEGYGRCRNFSREIEEGRLPVEDHSHFGIANRLAAAGLGVPFLPIRSMAGTDILNVSGFEEPSQKWARMEDPFGGPPVTVVAAVSPDAAVLHAQRADRAGNIQVDGVTAVIEEQARAARRLIVSVEEIVEASELRRHPEATLIPSFLVDAVVEAPFGAHPNGTFRYYQHDPEHIANYYAASRAPNTFATYLDEWVYGPKDEWAYLDKIGLSRLMALRVDPFLNYIPRDNAGGGDAR
jgi:glutaconate CoA-transferase subunit A